MREIISLPIERAVVVDNILLFGVGAVDVVRIRPRGPMNNETIRCLI